MLANVKTVAMDQFQVEYEIESIFDNQNKNSNRKKLISNELEKIDSEIENINKQIEKYNSEIEKLTNHADGIDYIVAVASGVLAGMIDVLFVEDFSFERANHIGEESVNNFVMNIAKKKAGTNGENIKTLKDAVSFLENEYPMAGDKVMNSFGGGLQHHLRDFSHHPTLIGLFFSILTQFTKTVYGTDVTGKFIPVRLEEKDLILIGKNIPEKITFGVINWFFHLVSDMAGSSSSIAAGKSGTGLPGPIVSLLKEISSLPIFKKSNEKGYREFSVWISKLFNGTLLGQVDENGRKIPMRFDLRTEIGMGALLAQQAIPVIINESVVRGFYFIRRLFDEIKNNEIHSFKQLNQINWRNTLPANNRTIVRMLSISTGTMTAIDLADAAIESAIKSGGITNPAFATNMIVKVNFVGVGRFALAVGTDVAMGIKKGYTENKKKNMLTEKLIYSNVKLYYKNAEVQCNLSELHEKMTKVYMTESEAWVELNNTQKTMNELYEHIKYVGTKYAQMYQEIELVLEEIDSVVPNVKKMNPGLIEDILGRLSD